MKIVSLDYVTKEMKEQGVVELSMHDQIVIGDLVKFNSIPTQKEVLKRCRKIADIVDSNNATHCIVKMNYSALNESLFVSEIEKQLAILDIKVVYPCSKKERTENGVTIKFLGFYIK